MRLIQAQHLKKETAHHLRDELLIVAEIGNGTDRLRQDKKSISVMQIGSLQQFLHRLQAHDDTREIVVHHGRMAKMRAQNKCLGAVSARNDFSDLQGSGAGGRANNDVIVVLCQRGFQLRLQQRPQSRS